MPEVETTRIAFRRIVLSFAAGNAPGPALEAAAALARLLDAELLGLFFENTALFDYAKLPFARELAPGAPWRALPLERLAGDYVAMASALQRRLRAAAAGHGVRVEFEVVRGDPATSLARAAADDLLALLEPADPLPFWPLAQSASSGGRLYLPRRLRRVRGPVAVVAARADDAATAVAARIAAASGEGLIVLGADGNGARRALPSATYLRLPASTPAAVAAALQTTRERLLVIGQPADEAVASGWLRLASERGVPLLIVAGPEAARVSS